LLNEKRCQTAGCHTRKSFNAKLSPTYSTIGRLLKISYAKGGVTIELAKDTFFFEDLQVVDQEFGVILNEEGLFQAASYDGIIGFSYPSLSDNTKPFFDRIIEMQVLPKNIFALYLSRNQEISPSKLFLGGFDRSLIEGNINYHPVVKKTWWTLNLDAVLVDGKDTGLCHSDLKCSIIMDTGSSLMATPPWALNSLLSQISTYSDCRNINNFPSLTFIIDGKHYTLDAYEYVLTSLKTIKYDPKPNSHHALGESDCTFGFSIFDVGKDNVWIAGDIFLSKYFTVYDRDNDRVGIARAKLH
jgi:cathepsin D